MQIIKEFCNLTTNTEEEINSRWSDVESRLLKYAVHEDRKLVKSLLTSYNECEEKSEGQ